MADQKFNADQQTALGITAGLLLLTTVVVCLRLYARRLPPKGGSAGWDDLTLLVAWFMALGASAVTLFEITVGLGRHMGDESSQEQTYRANLSSFIVLHCYSVGLNMVKISFLAQYWRVFRDVANRWICLSLSFFCFLCMFVQAFLYSFNCVPIELLVPSMASACISSRDVWMAVATVNVGTNMTIICVPIRPLWRMRMSMRQKYAVLATFCLGLVICAISIIRIPTILQSPGSTDPAFNNITARLWSLAELELAIICASLPYLRPIVSRFACGASCPDASPYSAHTGPGRPDETGCGSNKRTTGEPKAFETYLSGTTLETRSQSMDMLTSRNRIRDDHDQKTRPGDAETRHYPENYLDLDEEKTLERSKAVESDYRITAHEEKSDPTGRSVKVFQAFALESGELQESAEDCTRRTPTKLATATIKTLHRTNSLPKATGPPSQSFTTLARTFFGSPTTKPPTTKLPRSPQVESFSRPRRPSSDLEQPHASRLQPAFSHLCSSNSGLSSAQRCSVCTSASSEILPQRLRSPLLSPGPSFGYMYPHQPQSPGAASFAATSTTTTTTQTIAQRDAQESHARRNFLVTQSGQSVFSWDDETSSAEEDTDSSSQASPEPSTSPDHSDVGEADRRIARARARTLHAMAGTSTTTTTAAAGEVQHAKARIVEVDYIQRRRSPPAAVLDEVLRHMDPARPPSRPRAASLVAGRATTAAVDSRDPWAETDARPPTTTPRQMKRRDDGDYSLAGGSVGGHERETVSLSLPGPVGGAAGNGESRERPSGTPTSWLRLSNLSADGLAEQNRV